MPLSESKHYYSLHNWDALDRISGDHKTTIATFVDLIGENDLLQTNTINGENVYVWLMKLRDRVNYRERCFHEPSPKYFYRDAFGKDKLNNFVRIYMNDEAYVYCFDPDHACLAMPIKVSLDVSEKFNRFAGENLLENEKLKVLDELTKNANLGGVNEFKKIINI